MAASRGGGRPAPDHAGRPAAVSRTRVRDRSAPTGRLARRIPVTENGRRVEDVGVAARQRPGSATAPPRDRYEPEHEGRAASPRLAAGRSFVPERREAQIGVVAFDGDFACSTPRPDDGELLAHARARRMWHSGRASTTPWTDRSRFSTDARLSTGSIVLLSDGADLGSRSELDRVIAKARAQHVRVFTVGLRSKAFAPSALRNWQRRAVAASRRRRLRASWHRSTTRSANVWPANMSSGTARDAEVGVDVKVEIHGVGVGNHQLHRSHAIGARALHRSLLSRFLLSGSAVALLRSSSPACAGALAALLRSRGARSSIACSSSPPARPRLRRATKTRGDRVAMRQRATRGGWAASSAIELARLEMVARESSVGHQGRAPHARRPCSRCFCWGCAPICLILALLTPLGRR